MSLDQAVVDAPARSPGRPDAAPRAERIVLHVGCGPADPTSLHARFRGREWRELRVDLDPSVRPDLLASIVDLGAIADSSIDAVWSSHNLEHLSAHDVPRALSEFHRVLKAGGLALITLPDLQQIAHFIVEDRLDDVAYVSPAGPITPLDCLYGHGASIARGRALMAHRTGFTATTLRKHLERAGFAEVRTSFAPFALWAEARKAVGRAVA